MKTKKQSLYLLLCLYCVFTVVQNLFEMKSLGTTEMAIMGGGTIVSWIPFMAGDIITDVYGKKYAVKSFTLAAILNLIVVVLAQIVIWFPGPYAEQNAAFAQIFSNGLRTAAASFIAFMLGNYINVAVMSKLKPLDKLKDSAFKFFIRAVLSTIMGQFFDNFVFLMIAFAPIGISAFEMTWMDIFNVTVSGTMIEIGIETILVPVITIPVAKYIENKPE